MSLPLLKRREITLNLKGDARKHREFFTKIAAILPKVPI